MYVCKVLVDQGLSGSFWVRMYFDLQHELASLAELHPFRLHCRPPLPVSVQDIQQPTMCLNIYIWLY